MVQKINLSESGRAAFYRPYKKGGKAQWIAKLQIANWKDPSNPTYMGTAPPLQRAPDKIPDAARMYYKHLYKPAPQTAATAAARKKLIDTLKEGKRVLPPTAEACSKPITTEEIQEVMEHVPLGKSAGPDRLPNAFYRTMAKTIAPRLTGVLNEARKIGHLPKDFRQGLISVLYKKKTARILAITDLSLSLTGTIRYLRGPSPEE